jgi:small GTP-binding protein
VFASGQFARGESINRFHQEKKDGFNNSIQMSTHPSYKLVVIGDTSVGKSSLVLRQLNDEFYPYQESTIGAAFLTQMFQFGPGQQIKLEIWDTAGQERYKSLVPLYTRGAAIAIVVFDITCRSSFGAAQYWVKELRKGEDDLIIALVGNKTDMDDQRVVSQAEAESYSLEEGLLYWETSAKTGHNIEKLFNDLAQAAYERNPLPVKDMSPLPKVTEHQSSYRRCCWGNPSSPMIPSSGGT